MDSIDKYLVNYFDSKFSLNNTEIETVHEKTFENNVNLELINLNKNKIDFVQLNAFHDLKILNKLTLSFNCLSTIENSIFKSLANLESLEITNNQIKIIYPNAFEGLGKLKRLILAFNQIQYLYPETFNGLVEMNLLVLSFNCIKSIHPDLLKQNAKLKRLNFRKNQIKTIDENTFCNLKELEQLALSMNQIEYIKPNTLQHMPNLKRLFMHTNHITHLEKSTFKDLRQLKLLDFGYNRIVSIEKDTFADLCDLEILDLSRNQLERLDSSIFENLAKVSEIYLSKNQISNIDNVNMSHLVNLKVFKFDMNQITRIDADLFKSCKSLLEIFCNTLEPANMKQLQENIIATNKADFLSCIEFICNQPETSNLADSIEAYEKLDYISYFSNRYKLELFKLIDEAKQNKLLTLIIHNVGSLSTNLQLHIDKFKPFIYKPETVAIKVFESLIAILNNWTNVSSSFCKMLAEKSGIQPLIGLLNSDILKSNILTLVNSDSKYMYAVMLNIYSNLLSLVYNLIKKTYAEFKQEFVEQKTFECLIKVAETFDQISDFRLKSYLSLASIFEDKDVLQLENLKLVIKELTSYAAQCARLFNENKNLERCPISFGRDDEAEKKEQPDQTKTNESIVIQLNDSYFYLIDFLNTLYNFSVSDEIKYDIYETYAMKHYLRAFIYKGNSVEKEFSLKLLCQLCFDKRIADDVREDVAFVSFLKDLISTESENKKILRNLDGIFFNLNEKLHSESDSKPRARQAVGVNANNNNNNNSDGHIMISYNSKSREVCLNIKKHLESIGYKVWIDVEGIYGSSLEAMASAIETSCCVLVCITEKYKESSFCRLEAEYLIQQKKPFIPLLMQKGYKPDGWLGIIVGSKIFIDFTKLEFSSALNELNRNLNLVLKTNNVNSSNATDNQQAHGESQQSGVNANHVEILVSSNKDNAMSQPMPPKEAEWDEKKVEKWLNKVNVDKIIVNNILPCSGQVLYQLYKMLVYNPEFFYGSLKLNNENGNTLKDMKNLAFFCSELKLLFESKN